MQKKVPYVAQLGNMDCSIACMTMLFRYYGLDVDIVDVGQVVHIGRDGVNLTQLKQATQQFGFKCTAYRYNKQKNILDSNLPAVVYSGSHLAVIGSKTVLGQYILLDPIKGKSIVNFEQIHDTFSDILITIRPEKRIKRKKCKPKLKVAINYKLVAGIISLMLLIQALTLSIPLVEQALIDSITQSQSLLNSAYILVGCIVIAGLYFFLSIARQKLMLRLDISFVKEIMTKMLKKLFDIDPSFFEWHAVGEIVNRFSNVQAINNIIINTFSQTSVYKGYKQDKIEMRGDRAEMSDFPLYLNTVAGGLDRRDQTIGGFSFVVKIYALPVVEIIGQLLYLLGRYGFNAQFGDCL